MSCAWAEMIHLETDPVQNLGEHESVGHQSFTQVRGSVQDTRGAAVFQTESETAREEKNTLVPPQTEV